MRFTYRVSGASSEGEGEGETLSEVEVARQPDGRYKVTVDGAVLDLHVERRGDAIDLVNAAGATVRAWVTLDGRFRHVTAPGVADTRIERVEGRRRSGAEHHAPEIASPMPGRVVKVLVAEGDAVTKGQPLVVVEAMKTELTLAAPRDGVVRRVLAVAGTQCDGGKPLIEMT